MIDLTSVLVTRGDVGVSLILATLPGRAAVVWDNSVRDDLGAFGRYAALAEVSTAVVYAQDDDCLVPVEAQVALIEAYEPGLLVSNMNPDHNTGMPHLALPGWGCVFDADLPEKAFARWRAAHPDDWLSDDFLRIGCDIVFPVLTRSRMIDLGHTNLPHAYGEDRTWRRPDYLGKKHFYYREAERLR